MEIYLVGGAVRDQLMGRAVTDRDWVVVGSTAEEMIELGYRPVGSDFPVFLHPESHEEYALARTERKTGKGYHGFNFHAAADVTLEEDLLRRDLTINALAEDLDGNLIDPFNGAADIKQKVFRHVSDAFMEDPVRILRVARFSSRYHDFGIAEETQALMTRMVVNEEVAALVPERVWQELNKALGEDTPERFIEVLRGCGALAVILPEIDQLFGVPQPEKWHPEIDTGVHTQLVLQQATKLSKSREVRFAGLVHDLGKATTPKDILPSHHGHEQRGAKIIKKLAARLRIPNDFRDLAMLTSKYHTHVHKAAELKASTVCKTLKAVDAYRKPERFEHFLLACEADARGRTGLEDRPYPQADYYRQAADAARNVDIEDLKAADLSGQKMAQEIERRRKAAVADIPKP